ncbi:hypothetical protein MPY17_34100 [Rhodococcus opacus]|uniref:hypothetical protein n=1 Tax=Rhodococcus opacus TaxID=37919 RepID=UPI001FF4C129|nr:hypothetical protein [Rhodococcus opacus]UOT03872.1 hypothetical protein MPY17_34100 [Rhodococcus opacus]
MCALPELICTTRGSSSGQRSVGRDEPEAEGDDEGPIQRWTPLDVRIEAVEHFADCAEHVLTVGAAG